MLTLSLHLFLDHSLQVVTVFLAKASFSQFIGTEFELSNQNVTDVFVHSEFDAWVKHSENVELVGQRQSDLSHKFGSINSFFFVQSPCQYCFKKLLFVGDRVRIVELRKLQLCHILSEVLINSHQTLYEWELETVQRVFIHCVESV